MFSFVIQFIWPSAQIIIACSLLLPLLLHFIFFLQKKGQKQTLVSEELFEEKDFAIIVSVQHSVENLKWLIQSLLQLDYHNYVIYVVTNKNFQPVFYNDDARIVWLQVYSDAMNVQSFQRHVFDHFRRPHTHTVFLDESCTADANFLNGLNIRFHQGFQVVQCRKLRNANNGLASRLQAVNSLYNRFFQSHLLSSLHSSATVAGSGFAFNVSFYKTYLQSANAVVTDMTDILHSLMVNKNLQIAFAKKAVLVEQNKQQVSPFHFLLVHPLRLWWKLYCSRLQRLCKGIVCLDKNLLLSGLPLLRLPLFATLFLSLFCLVVNIFTTSVAAFFWMIGLLLFALNMLSLLRPSQRSQPASSQRRFVVTGLTTLYEEAKSDSYSTAQPC